MSRCTGEALRPEVRVHAVERVEVEEVEERVVPAHAARLTSAAPLQTRRSRPHRSSPGSPMTGLTITHHSHTSLAPRSEC